MLEIGIAPPEKAKRNRRITEEMKKMQPGHSILVSSEVMPCLISYGRRSSWETRRSAQPDGGYRIWRVS